MQETAKIYYIHDSGRIRLIVLRNKDTQKFVTNLFKGKYLDHWNATLILIFKVHQISGFCHAMRAKRSEF